MHPVLARTLHPIAEEIATVSLAEGQVSPNVAMHRWCGQQVVEHLILAFMQSQDELLDHLKSRKPAPNIRTTVQWIVKAQLCWFGGMSRGVPTLNGLRPRSFAPLDGPALAARFLSEAETLDKVLIESRQAFGLQPCGVHPIYGSLRVDEWRNYHAVHCRHHLYQFREAIAFARAHPELLRENVPSIVEIERDSNGEDRVVESNSAQRSESRPT